MCRIFRGIQGQKWNIIFTILFSYIYYHLKLLTASSLHTEQTTASSISDFHFVISVVKQLSDNDVTVISLEILKQKKGSNKMKLLLSLLCVLSLFWQINDSQYTSVGRWRESMTITDWKETQVTILFNFQWKGNHKTREKNSGCTRPNSFMR